MTPTSRKWKSLKYSLATWAEVPDQVGSGRCSTFTAGKLTSDDVMMPKKGKRMAGSMAAMASGMASVIQKMAISSRT